jgi:hypothetical protein
MTPFVAEPMRSFGNARFHEDHARELARLRKGITY